MTNVQAQSSRNSNADRSSLDAQWYMQEDNMIQTAMRATQIAYAEQHTQHIHLMYVLYIVMVDDLKVIHISDVAGGIVVLVGDKLVFLG